MKIYSSSTKTGVTDFQIKELINKEVLTNEYIADKGIETALRRILFYSANKIDWQDAYEQIIDQMPELELVSLK